MELLRLWSESEKSGWRQSYTEGEELLSVEILIRVCVYWTYTGNYSENCLISVDLSAFCWRFTDLLPSSCSASSDQSSRANTQKTDQFELSLPQKTFSGWVIEDFKLLFTHVPWRKTYTEVCFYKLHVNSSWPAIPPFFIFYFLNKLWSAVRWQN